MVNIYQFRRRRRRRPSPAGRSESRLQGRGSPGCFRRRRPSRGNLERRRGPCPRSCRRPSWFAPSRPRCRRCLRRNPELLQPRTMVHGQSR